MLAPSLRRTLVPTGLGRACYRITRLGSYSKRRHLQISYSQSIFDKLLLMREVHDDSSNRMNRSLSTTTTASPSPVSPTTEKKIPQKHVDPVEAQKDPLEGLFSSPISMPRIYRYLNLKNFSDKEIGAVFDRISDGSEENSTFITRQQLRAFLLTRIKEMEDESDEISPHTPEAQFLREKFVEAETNRIMETFKWGVDKSIEKQQFIQCLRERASKVDFSRTLPIISSMLIVGASVGIVTPAMPFVVDNLGLSTAQYGLVVSAFALSKMAANIPSAIFVERHGRKPYMVHSMLVISLGVGGIGLVQSFEELYLCRLLTGTGVSFLRYVVSTVTWNFLLLKLAHIWYWKRSSHDDAYRYEYPVESSINNCPSDVGVCRWNGIGTCHGRILGRLLGLESDILSGGNFLSRCCCSESSHSERNQNADYSLSLARTIHKFEQKQNSI